MLNCTRASRLASAPTTNASAGHANGRLGSDTADRQTLRPSTMRWNRHDGQSVHIAFEFDKINTRERILGSGGWGVGGFGAVGLLRSMRLRAQIL